ncbi:MAG TPA: NADH-quinone oxidoreductase subunit C [Chloroflexota bacterium]
MIARLRQALGDAIEGDEQVRGQLIVRIGRERLVDACRLLRDDPNLRFEHLSDVTAVDYLLHNPDGGRPGDGRTPRFDVVYHLYSIARGHRLRIKVGLDEADPVLPSLVELWPAANWGERETFDMYGIEFSGHPNLTRILMPDDWQGNPLRKDYPLIEEEIEFTSTLDRLNERRPSPGRLEGPAT